MKYLILFSLFALTMAGCTTTIRQDADSEWQRRLQDPAVWCDWGKRNFPSGKNRTVTIGDVTYSCGE